MTDDAEAAQPSPEPVESNVPPAPKRRGRETPFDMIRSLGLVLLVALALLAVTWRAKPDPVRVVDLKSATSAARFQVDWPVLSPEGLTDNWRATSARLSAADGGAIEWYVGMVTPTENFASVAQSDPTGRTAVTKFVSDRTLQGVESGTSIVGGTTWRRFVSDDGRTRSLVRSDGGVTIVVSGTSEWAELNSFVTALRAG